MNKEENINNNSTKFIEQFDDINDRLNYINKVYNLRPEGRIVKIHLSPNYEKTQIVRIINEKSLIFACPIDEYLPKIFIKMKKFRRIEFIKKLDCDPYFKNKYFLVRIVGWALNFKCPKGIVVNEMGNSGDIDVETEVLLRTYEIDHSSDYPQQAMDELKQFENSNFEEEILNGREDLRKQTIFTIDPKHSKDLDDAISVEVINEEAGLLEIGVHIADPSHFVNTNTMLDKEASNRVTTIYLVHKNIPMLPRVLSENLCSLLPFKDRLAFSCVFRIYLNGALDVAYKPKFFLSIINLSAKWNYELVQKIINKEEINYEDLSILDGTKSHSEEIYISMCKKVQILHKLTKLVRSQRIESGSLIIENDEINFEIDEESKCPIGFRIKNKLDSNYLIEELMLIANKLTAEFLYDNMKDYALIRKHPFLNDNKFLEIQRYLSVNKLVVDFEDAQALNNMLSKIKKNNFNKYICIQRKLKNFMQRAEYVISGCHEFEDLRHSALNFDLYTHFTSPIRRYPDLIIHRQLKYILKRQHNHTNDDKKEFSNLDKLTENFNEKYINGKLISSKCQKLFFCILLKNSPVQIYKALVVDINYKSNAKNKRNVLSNQINQTDLGPTLTVNVFIIKLNLEIVRTF